MSSRHRPLVRLRCLQRDEVKRAFPHFVDHQTDTGSAIRSGELRWKDIPFSGIIWFDESHALKGITISIHLDDSGQMKQSFERIQKEFFETYGEPSVTDIRASGYKRFEWALSESNVSVAFLPNARFAGNAVLSYRAPKTERAEQGADDRSATAVKSKSE